MQAGPPHASQLYICGACNPTQVEAGQMTTARLRTYCTPFCAKHVADDMRVRIHDEPGHFRHLQNSSATPPPSKHGRCASGVQALRRSCRAFRKVDCQR